MDTLTLTSEAEEFTLSEIASDPSDGIHGKFMIHSFVIRMWQEQSDDKTHPAIWRGRITHIPDNKHQHFTDLKILVSFIESYLKE